MNLFDEKKIGKQTFKNSFFRAATWEGLASAEGHITDELMDIYIELARGGVAAIITGYARILEEEKANKNMMAIYSDDYIEEYSKLTDMVHGYGCRIILQVAYGGSMSSANSGNNKIYAPSKVENERTGIIPSECSLQDMNYIKDAFVNAAVRAEKAGFDGIELHAGHGYFLSQWLSPKYNIRTDEYGGSIDNRARYIGEIIRYIRKEVSDDFLILIKQNSEDYHEEGLSAEDSIEASKLFQKEGVDAIEVTGGDMSIKKVTDNNLGASRGKLVRRRKNESYFKNHAGRLSDALNIEVILTGGNRHLSTMQNISNESNVKFFAMARPLVCEANLINKWKNGESKATKCVSCNGCFNKNGQHCVMLA